MTVVARGFKACDRLHRCLASLPGIYGWCSHRVSVCLPWVETMEYYLPPPLYSGGRLRPIAHCCRFPSAVPPHPSRPLLQPTPALQPLQPATPKVLFSQRTLASPGQADTQEWNSETPASESYQILHYTRAVIRLETKGSFLGLPTNLNYASYYEYDSMKTAHFRQVDSVYSPYVSQFTNTVNFAR